MSSATLSDADAGVKPPVSLVVHGLFPVLVVAVVAVTRQSMLVRAATVGAYAAMVYTATQCTLGPDKLVNYSLGVWFGTNCFCAWWLLLYEDPVKNVRHVDDTVEPEDMPLLQRTFWVTTLWFSARGIGWNVQVRGGSWHEMV